MSYGVISTWTLSPGKIRIRCIRIFPELCASTVYPFSNSTRNIAFGNGSTTVPSTVNASSFGLLRFILLVAVQHAQGHSALTRVISQGRPRDRLDILPIFTQGAKEPSPKRIRRVSNSSGMGRIWVLGPYDRAPKYRHAGTMVLSAGGPFEREHLDREQSLARLAEASMARVLISLRCLPAALPVYLAIFDRYLIIASREAAVVAAAQRGDVLAVQADGTTTDATTWSVQVTGVAHVPRNSDQLSINATESLIGVLGKGATLVAIEMTVVSGEIVHWSFPS